MTDTPLTRALAEWSVLLAAERVTWVPEALAHAGRTTLPAAPLPAAILHPAARTQVPDIVRIAARHRVPLHPISSGSNWGWGDSCPATDGQVLLDLGSLDHITVDEELGCAVVEPGVTQGALARHLVATGSAWRLDCAGAGPLVSLVGNALERGLTFGAWGDRFEAVAAWRRSSPTAPRSAPASGPMARRGRPSPAGQVWAPRCMGCSASPPLAW